MDPNCRNPGHGSSVTCACEAVNGSPIARLVYFLRLFESGLRATASALCR